MQMTAMRTGIRERGRWILQNDTKTRVPTVRPRQIDDSCRTQIRGSARFTNQNQREERLQLYNRLGRFADSE